MDFQLAPDIKTRLTQLVKQLQLVHIKPKQLYAFRSFGSKARARARIWALPRIWQLALKLNSGYCIEVISEKFDNLSQADQTRVLIHELMHIPKTFSGALLPHRGRKGRVKIDSQSVNQLFKRLGRSKPSFWEELLG